MELSNGFKLEQLGLVSIIRFDRPEIRNPLSIDLLEALRITIAELRSSSTEVLIFTGSEEVFASGADLREIAKVTPQVAKEFAQRGQTLMKEISSLSITTIAAVNGYCFGGALDLALACDVRIASSNAEFCHPGAGLGIMTGWGGTQRLPRLIGEAAALEMLITGRRIGSEEALALGLISRVDDDPVAVATASYLSPRL
jgi:enoyl-CoA hydratase